MITAGQRVSPMQFANIYIVANIFCEQLTGKAWGVKSVIIFLSIATEISVNISYKYYK